MVDIPDEFLGPAMLGLSNPKHRHFAYLMGLAEVSGAEAARQAGYSDHMDAARVQASRMMQKPEIIEAVREVAGKVLGGLVPLAIRAAKRILEDPKHPAHARMAESILDRTGFSAKTEHKVTVEHTADLAQLEEYARRLALE